jgi:hypothetical protein
VLTGRRQQSYIIFMYCGVALSLLQHHCRRDITPNFSNGQERALQPDTRSLPHHRLANRLHFMDLILPPHSIICPLLFYHPTKQLYRAGPAHKEIRRFYRIRDASYLRKQHKLKIVNSWEPCSLQPNYTKCSLQNKSRLFLPFIQETDVH